jgi:hypothetical protein
MKIWRPLKKNIREGKMFLYILVKRGKIEGRGQKLLDDSLGKKFQRVKL